MKNRTFFSNMAFFIKPIKPLKILPVNIRLPPLYFGRGAILRNLNERSFIQYFSEEKQSREGGKDRWRGGMCVPVYFQYQSCQGSESLSVSHS